MLQTFVSILLVTLTGVFLQTPVGAAEIPFLHTVIDAKNPKNPHCKAVGDIDGDGFVDLIIGSSDGDGLQWYQYPSWNKHRIADGSFTTDMQAADIDGDGDIDIVVPDRSGLELFLNPAPQKSSASGLWLNVSIGASGSENHDVELADMNNDGLLDVISRRKEGGGTYVWLQTTNTSVWTQITVSVAAGEGTAVGDIDGDGDKDIVQNGYWLENPGHTRDVTWASHDIDKNWPLLVGVVVTDLNRDGRMDILFAPSESPGGRLAWYETKTPKTGPWIEHSIDPDLSYVHTFKVADMDNDGDLDVVTAEMHQAANPREVSVYRNDMDGLRWTKQVVATTGSHNLRVADIGHDGDMDIVGANWSDEAPGGAPIEIWENKISDHFKWSLDLWERHLVDDRRPWRALFITEGDVNRDGFDDILTGGWWYENPARPGGAWVRHSFGEPLQNLAAVFDFDGDGDLDVLGSNWQDTGDGSTMLWGRNDGHGSFTILTNVAAAHGDFLQGVAVCRLERGGPLEVLLSWHRANEGIQSLSVPKDPSRSTWAWRQVSTTSQDEQLSVGDIDRDGIYDVLLGTWWLHEKASEWGLSALVTGLEVPDRNRLADINQDGRLDAVVGFEAISVPGKLVWFEQPAKATDEWPEHIIATVVGPHSVDVGDLDKDGDIDVVVGEHDLINGASARLIVFENVDGKGNQWQQHVIYTGDEHHDGAVLADVDKDGDLDILSIGWGHGKVLLYENLAVSAGASETATPLITPPASTYLEAITVGIESDTPGAEIRYTLDESEPTVESSLYEGPFALATTATVKARAFRTGLSDSAIATSVYVIDENATVEHVPLQGLEMWLQADAGVVTNETTVVEWKDQSGHTVNAVHELLAEAQPTFVPAGPQGRPTISFDGVDDFLSFQLPVNGWTGMTMVIVSANTTLRDGGDTRAGNAALFWNQAQDWGAVYLSPFQEVVQFQFGTTQAENFPRYFRPQSIGSQYSLTMAVKNETNDTLFVNGNVALQKNDALPAIAGARDDGSIGRGYNDDTYFAGEIAEVLVYSRALSESDRLRVETYLNTKYGLFASPPVSTPSIQPAGGVFIGPVSVTLASLTPNAEIHFSLDGILPTLESPLYDGPFVVTNDATLMAVAFKAGFSNSAPASAAFLFRKDSSIDLVSTQDLALWFRADAGVVTDDGAVAQWLDLSGHGIRALQPNAASRPTLVPQALNGRPAIQFDGTGDHLPFLLPVNGLTGMTIVLISASLADLDGGPTKAANCAIFWNLTADWGTVYLSPFQRLVQFKFGTTQAFDWPTYIRPESIETNFTTTISVKSGLVHSLYVNGALALSEDGKLPAIAGCQDIASLGRGYNDDTYFSGYIAEVMVYARALEDSERRDIESYLSQKYFPTFPSVRGQIVGYRGESGIITVSAGTRSTQVSEEGSYALALPPGNYDVTAAAPDVVFAPPRVNVTISSNDVVANFVGYRSNAMTIELFGSNNIRTLYAGETGRVYEILASTNLVDWTAISTNTIPNTGLLEFITTRRSPEMRFFKVFGP